MSSAIEKDLKAAAVPSKAKILAGYFKTYSGGYGEGDKFLGITVPVQRKIAKKHTGTSLDDISKLLGSGIHEHRFTALEILVMKFHAGDAKERKIIFDFYLKHTHGVNNWDLVDTSAPYIVGEYLLDKNRAVLYKLAKSKNVWERRIAIVATYTLIRNNLLGDTFKIAEILLKDDHDLIHKAVGWMLRETGKKNQPAEEEFLKKHFRNMPRTMLRYAIEKFDPTKKAYYMKK